MGVLQDLERARKAGIPKETLAFIAKDIMSKRGNALATATMALRMMVKEAEGGDDDDRDQPAKEPKRPMQKKAKAKGKAKMKSKAKKKSAKSSLGLGRLALRLVPSVPSFSAEEIAARETILETVLGDQYIRVSYGQERNGLPIRHQWAPKGTAAHIWETVAPPRAEAAFIPGTGRDLTPRRPSTANEARLETAGLLRRSAS